MGRINTAEEHLVKRNKNRELNKKGEAAGKGVNAVCSIQLHYGSCLFFFVVPMFFLKLLELRLKTRKRFLRTNSLLVDGKEHEPAQKRERDNCYPKIPPRNYGIKNNKRIKKRAIEDFVERKNECFQGKSLFFLLKARRLRTRRYD